MDSTTFAYVTLSVSGLLDGNAEVLILDGDTFALATDAPGQDTIGGNYHVRVSTGAGTATISIIKQGGGTFSEVEAETLIKAIQYQHTDTGAPTDGDRLIEVRVNDGTTDSAAARTTINIDPVNDAPSVATNTGITVNEASTGNVLTKAMLNEGDPDDAGTGLTYTVTAVTTNGTLRLSGTALGLNDTFT
ncbi:MAG: cadherin-like domain-containing protein [Nitrospirales bacterium]